MRNKILLIFIIFFFNQILFAENLQISAKNITIDNNKKTTIFNNEVSVLTSDNDVIKSDFAEYNKDSVVIPYGGDQYLEAIPNPFVFDEFDLPDNFDFAMARAQIDNNMEIILQAYVNSGLELVFVSNWKSSQFGMKMYEKYSHKPNLNLIGPIYDTGKIKALHLRARAYVHGHSAGGTNPVLVESMWAKLPAIAYDVSFNRFTTRNEAIYFSTAEELAALTTQMTDETCSDIAGNLFSVAQEFYKWEQVLSSYESVLFNGDC